MKQKINHIKAIVLSKVTQKRKGEYDLIVSLFVITALTMFMFMYLNFMADLAVRTDLDQVARKYILYLETIDLNASGTSKDAIKTDIKDDLEKIKGVTCKEVKIDSNGYGRTLTLGIKCDVKTTSWVPALNVFYALIGRDEHTEFVLNKQSTAKY